VSVADWNNVLASGWYFGNNAANSPAAGQYLVETIANNQLYILQFAYPFTNASTSTSAVLPSRRVSFDSGGGVIAWQPWETIGYVPTGTTIWVNGTTPPPGYLKENGALVSRASFPALTAFALASGNIVSEATWLAGSTGAFSTGDLSTTFRIPDARGEFIRAFDDGRGVDTGRVLGSHQVDLFKSHQHTSIRATSSLAGGINDITVSGGAHIIDDLVGLTGGVETRPRNNAKLACIKF